MGRFEAHGVAGNPKCPWSSSIQVSILLPWKRRYFVLFSIYRFSRVSLCRLEFDSGKLSEICEQLICAG